MKNGTIHTKRRFHQTIGKKQNKQEKVKSIIQWAQKFKEIPKYTSPMYLSKSRSAID